MLEMYSQVKGENAYQFCLQPPNAPAFIGNTASVILNLDIVNRVSFVYAFSLQNLHVWLAFVRPFVFLLETTFFKNFLYLIYSSRMNLYGLMFKPTWRVVLDSFSLLFTLTVSFTGQSI